MPRAAKQSVSGADAFLLAFSTSLESCYFFSRYERTSFPEEPQLTGIVPSALVLLAETPAGVSAPLRGAAAQPRPSSLPRGFTPNPAAAARPPIAARRHGIFRHFFWRAAIGVHSAIYELQHRRSLAASAPSNGVDRGQTSLLAELTSSSRRRAPPRPRYERCRPRLAASPHFRAELATDCDGHRDCHSHSSSD